MMLSCIFGPDLRNLRFLNSSVSTPVSTLVVYMMLGNVYVNEIGIFVNGVTKFVCLMQRVQRAGIWRQLSCN